MKNSIINYEDWMNRKWRPVMAFSYLGICIFDFVIFPILWASINASLGQPLIQWKPITLEGAGLFHMTFMTVLGVAAWTRGQEKITAMNIYSQETSKNQE